MELRMTQKMIDLEDYVTLEQAQSLDEIGYPKGDADYYWWWKQPSIFEDAIWTLSPKKQVLKANGGKLVRCVAAPLKVDAVAWKLTNEPKSKKTFTGTIHTQSKQFQYITIRSSIKK